MKLSAHYNKANIIITLSVLFAGAVIYFFAINYIAKNQLDRNLIEEIDGVKDYIKLNQQLPKQVDFDEDQVIFVKTDRQNLQRRFFDTIYNNPKERKKEAGRAVSCLISLNGNNYETTIIVSREDTEYLVQIIGFITLILSIGLLLILFLTNRYILTGLWKSFYATLTPLAVITSKLDTLIQDETLKNYQFDQINDIYAAAGRLARLNQSLLLLVKIENNLIEDAEQINLDILISEKLKQFHELIFSMNIQVEKNLQNKQVLASKYLMDILFNNLFSNAIRHNTKNGKLIITLTDDKLIFQNSGGSTPLNPDKVFERFQKGNKSEGTGLGLALVKNICTLNNWTISYYYDNILHTFQIAL